jgi:hypothetical protein
VDVRQEWGPGTVGLVTDLSGQAPVGGVIATAEAWERLWRAWRPGEPVPDVDFGREMVLVAAGPGPNHVIVRELRLTDAGDLRFEWAITEMAGPGFVAKMLLVDRRGVKTVNGRPLPAA